MNEIELAAHAHRIARETSQLLGSLAIPVVPDYSTARYDSLKLTCERITFDLGKFGKIQVYIERNDKDGAQ